MIGGGGCGGGCFAARGMHRGGLGGGLGGRGGDRGDRGDRDSLGGLRLRAGMRGLCVWL